MARVTGIGGVFFKAQDPDRLRAWYGEHLGLPPNEHGVIPFYWRDADRPEQAGTTLLSPFPADTTYFEPSRAPFMLNLRVDDLDGLLAQLRREGVTVDERTQDEDYGRFAWIMDPEGNRIELWEPPPGSAGRSA